jgi:prepilin-type processing-associated H-X9-DG protein
LGDGFNWIAAANAFYQPENDSNRGKSFSGIQETPDGPESRTSGPLPPDEGVYDGVIVRTPFRPLTYSSRTKGVGDFEIPAGVPDPVKVGDITDGTSNTMMFSEKYVRVDLYETGSPSDDRGWSDGWDPDVMRISCIQPANDSQNNDFGNGFPFLPGFNEAWETLLLGSAHPGGINAVFADGSVHSISYDVDVQLLNYLGTRNGEELVDPNSFK